MQGYSISNRDHAGSAPKSCRERFDEFLAADLAAEDLAYTDTAKGWHRIAVEVSGSARLLEEH